MLEVHDAGTGEGSLPLVVFMVGHGAAEEDAECEQFDWWLSAGEEVEHLLHVCNNGYGARGIGEDEITVENNLFTHTRTGGSAWGWSSTHVLRLSPLRLLSESYVGDWTLGPNTSSSTWDWTTFSGGVTWSAPVCGASEGEAEDLEYAWIPSVTAPAGYAQEGWRRAVLGGCSLQVDGARGGKTIFGKPDRPDDSSFRIVALDERTLIVEVEDDVWVDGTRSWVESDHLELWVSRAEPSYMSPCLQRPAPALQWGIRLSDGKVFPAAGRPGAPLQVERTEVRRGERRLAVRLRISLPEPFPRLSVVYSDSDDGRRQERLIATSKLKFGDGATLGGLYSIAREHAVCEVRSGKLEPKQTRTFSSREPALGD